MELSDIEIRALELLKYVFPDGLHDEERLPLMYILKDETSFRVNATIVGAFIDLDYVFLLNDVYRVASSGYEPDQDIVSRIRQQLNECGYQAWLDEGS